MSDTPHHTEEQIQKAFAYAPKVLKKLREAGVKSPKFELYDDASGILLLGKEGEITYEQYDLARELVFSNRQAWCKEVGIVFCCGLVTGAEKEEEMND